MKIDDASLDELARVHGYDIPMFPNPISAERNIHAIVSVFSDVLPGTHVPVLHDHVCNNEARTVILIDVKGWQTPIYFDKWGFVAENLGDPLTDNASFAETYHYIASALNV